jgi:lysophospholipase L1-like esterase
MCNVNHKSIKTKKAVLVSALAAAALLVGFGSTLAIALFRMGKRPNNTPEKFTARSGESLVVCIGDSITQGTVSANYVNALSRDTSLTGFTFVNAGVNGDLAYNALMRTEGILALNPDYIIILLGTNDANATLSPDNARMYIKDKNLPEQPTKEWYKKNLSDLIDVLKQKSAAKIAILSIPVIGEKLDSVEIQITRDYSAITAKLAKDHDIVYLPLNENQIAFLTAQNHEPGTLYSPRESIELMVKNAYRHYILHEDWNTIARSRGLLLTTDTLHQNDTSASMIRALISGFLLGKQAS